MVETLKTNVKKKFKSLEEAKEFLIETRDNDTDISQNQFMDAIADLGLDEAFVAQICRIRVTHPGVTAHGILDKVEVNRTGR